MKQLQIKNLSCHYGSELVLDNLNLSLDNNEILCLLGSSGCGKTTLLKAIAGLIPISSGSISFDNQDITHEPVEKRNIGLIFQDYALFPHLTVKQNICFGLHNKSNADKNQICADMINLVHLQGLEKRYPHELSGGQQQRVAIARALACKPKLLLLDEPFSNIDSQVRYQLINEIKSIIKAQNVSAIFVTHAKEEAFAFADTLSIMDKGHIIQIGSPDVLYQKPHCRFVAEFLGQVNYLNCTKHDDNSINSEFGCSCFNQALKLADGSDLDANSELEWMLRPQHITIKANENGNATIISSLFLGNFFSYKVKTAKYTFTVHSHISYKVGDKVDLSYDCHSPVLFKNVG